MRSSLGAKRKPRRVGQDEEEERSGEGQVSDDGRESNPTRLQMASRVSSKTKKRSSLRVSFGPGGTSMTEDDGAMEPAVFTPKKSNLSRQAVEKNALRKSLSNSLSSGHPPLRQNEERPSYSKETLNELKTSTPSTPKDLRSLSDIDAEETKALDLASKFGTGLALHRTPAIPTETEIREKKARRARLAKEQDFINLEDNGNEDDDDDDASSNDERSILPYNQPKPKPREETRLVRDDEDIAEGFDEFVNDGRIALGKKAEKEQKRRREAEVRALIEDAEGGNSSADSSEDESEVERRATYEAAQTKAGMDGLRKEELGAKPRRPGTPPRISPLPSLEGCLERLRAPMAEREYLKQQRVGRLEAVRKELEDIRVREREVQKLIDESGPKWTKLMEEAGGGGGGQGLLENGINAS